MAADTRALAPDADERVMLADEVPEYDDYGTALLSLTRGRPRRFWHAVARVDGAYAGHAWAHRAAGVAGLYDVDVLPRARRRGLGRALTGVVAGAAGARWAVLNATGQGERLYAALGFRSLGHGRTWWRHRPPSRP